jgi:hypothetical protein
MRLACVQAATYPGDVPVGLPGVLHAVFFIYLPSISAFRGVERGIHLSAPRLPQPPTLRLVW